MRDSCWHVAYEGSRTVVATPAEIKSVLRRPWARDPHDSLDEGFVLSRVPEAGAVHLAPMGASRGNLELKLPGGKTKRVLEL